MKKPILCDMRTKKSAVDILILRAGTPERLAKAAAYRVAAAIETKAHAEGRPYTVTITGPIVRLDFSTELDAPETREGAADIATEVAIEACADIALEPATCNVIWPGDPGPMPSMEPRAGDEPK